MIRNLRLKPKFYLLMHADTFQNGLGPLKHIATETEESRVGETKRDVEHTNWHATNIDVIKNRIWRFVMFNLVSGCRGMDGARIVGKGLVALLEQSPRIRDMIDVSILDRLGKRIDCDFRLAVVGERSHNPIAHGPAIPQELPRNFVDALPEIHRAVAWHLYKGVCFGEKIVRVGGYFVYEQDDGLTNVGQVLGAIQPASELKQVNVGWCSRDQRG
ncbi:hypothetical protein BCR44DRAFT_40440 [Catenaria anguillulae PL171]|uniref:Uncharacterized protein n=1 Tax=Catenaria anguillulae PL171 TaxID=765915 RepID=A0A1Y2HDP7_9FUNG|nr:hypothetical protein BCR44DRAFT_40440 [Catenaria anguillulae PL171]